MLKIIPAIDIKDGRCVRLQQGDFSRQTTYDDSPVQAAEKWDSLGASLIHIVDLDGAKNGRSANITTIKEICSTVSCECELGGGIRTLDAVDKALEAGISRVVFGTALAENPTFASALMNRFNANFIVGGLDARDGKITIKGWQEGSGKTPVGLAKSLFELGVRNFIYTDVSTDGMFSGPNIEVVSALCDSLPDSRFIASGGIGSASHLQSLVKLKKSNLYGVIVGKALYDGRLSYEELTKLVEHQKN